MQRPLGTEKSFGFILEARRREIQLITWGISAVRIAKIVIGVNERAV
jgi:hypothetical protein